jgi:hypothetical protein
MNTPSHAILNLAILGKATHPEANLLIVLGGILPDIPIFLFYGWAKLIAKMPEHLIWSQGYYSPMMQTIVAISHSIPLAMIGLAIATFYQWKILQILCLSLILHSLFDLPVHHDDAHRHFFPFSNYRFISPLSYWDTKHYGSIVSLVEILLVFFATIRAFSWVESPIGKGLMILVNSLSVISYFYFYVYLKYKFYVN